MTAPLLQCAAARARQNGHTATLASPGLLDPDAGPAPQPVPPLFFSPQTVAVVYGQGRRAAQLTAGLRAQLIGLGLSEPEAANSVLMVDDRGLVLQDRLGLESYKRPVALAHFPLRGWPSGGLGPSLLPVINVSKATTLIHLPDHDLPACPGALAALSLNTLAPRLHVLSPAPF